MISAINRGHEGSTMPDDMISNVVRGRQIVLSGQLRELREKLGLSRTAMAVLLYASPITYAQWETRPEARMWAATAEKIAKFYDAATFQLQAAEEDGVDMSTMYPFHIAATLLGVSHELLLRKYREGEVHATDLGILGLWVDKADMKKVSA